MDDQVRLLIATAVWPTLTPEQKYLRLQAIDPNAEVYELSYCGTKQRRKGSSSITIEEYATYDEAVDRATELQDTNNALFAGTHVDINDLGGNNFYSVYVK